MKNKKTPLEGTIPPKMNSFLPNAFQTPNAYIDEYLYLLTPEEYKVLSYMVRRIFGFNKRQDRISRVQLSVGTVKKNGERLDHGTGMCENANHKALAELVKFGFVKVVDKGHQGRKTPPMYRIQLDPDKIDKDGLEQRLAWKYHKDSRRVESGNITKLNRNVDNQYPDLTS